MTKETSLGCTDLNPTMYLKFIEDAPSYYWGGMYNIHEILVICIISPCNHILGQIDVIRVSSLP